MAFGFFISLATLLFALLAVLIFNWKAYTAIFVVGLGKNYNNCYIINNIIDVIFTIGFVIFLI